MSKTTTRSHIMAPFQMRGVSLSETAQASGEEGVALATLLNSMFELAAQNTAQLKGES